MDDHEVLTGADGDDEVRALLRDLASLVPEEPPQPRGVLADLLAGKRVLPRQRPSRRTVAGGTALAIGVVLGSGVAAAATNRLPDPAQRAAHDFARSFLPFAIPAPAGTRHHQVVTEPDAQTPRSLPSPTPEHAVTTDQHDAGDRAGEDASGTSGRHASGGSEDSEDSGDSGRTSGSGSDDRSGSETRDRDDGATTSAGSGDSDDAATTTSSGSGSGSDDSGGSDDDASRSGDSGDSGSDGGSSGSDDGGGSDPVDGD